MPRWIKLRDGSFVLKFMLADGHRGALVYARDGRAYAASTGADITEQWQGKLPPDGDRWHYY